MRSTQPSLIKCGMEGRLAHQEKCINLKSLDGTQEQLHLKLRKIDHLVASVGGRMTDHDQRVDMALW